MLFEGLESFGSAAFGEKGEAEVEGSVGLTRVEFESGGELIDGFFEAALFGQHESVLGVELCVTGIGGYCFAKFLFRGLGRGEEGKENEQGRQGRPVHRLRVYKVRP